MIVLIQTENKSIKDFPEYYICKNGDIYSKKNYNFNGNTHAGTKGV